MSHDRVVEHRVTVTLDAGYRFVVSFDDLPGRQELITDEPPPLGGRGGPSPIDLLAAAVGNCLSASLVFCLRKSRASMAGLTASVRARVERNEAGRLRVAGIDVELEPAVGEDDVGRLQRCEGLFEDFCTVTASLRAGIPVNVQVKPALPAPAGSEIS